jgi:hypothetical protein
VRPNHLRCSSGSRASAFRRERIECSCCWSDFIVGYSSASSLDSSAPELLCLVAKRERRVGLICLSFYFGDFAVLFSCLH